MVFLASSLCLFLFAFGQSTDFFLDLMIWGKQYSMLPRSYLFSLFIPIAINILCVFKSVRTTLSFRPIIAYLVFSFISLFLASLSLDFSLNIIYLYVKSLALFLFAYLSFSFLLSARFFLSSYIVFNPFFLLLLISSVSSLISLYIYQSPGFTPSTQVMRFTSTTSSEFFLNSFYIPFFGLVEPIPFKSFFARSHWFVREPVHFAFYLYSFFSLSVFSRIANKKLFVSSFFLLLLGLLCNKSFTSLFCIVFALIYYFIYKLLPFRFAFVSIVSFTFVPNILFVLASPFFFKFFSFFNKATNYSDKVYQFSSAGDFFATLLFGDFTYPNVSHNLPFDLFLKFGLFGTLGICISLMYCVYILFQPLLFSNKAIFVYSLTLSLFFIQVPSAYHPLYALLLAYISSVSYSPHYEKS